jgi:3-methyladenine DNA glycosylase/8-oxoguanine DNA glycosylase
VPTANEIAKAARALSKADPVLAGIIKRVGPITFAPPREPFSALARSIFYQQLAGPAAAAIMGRFLALYPGVEFPAPQQVLATPEEKLRQAGVSRQKMGYLKDLSAKFADGTLSHEKLRVLPDEELERALMSVKGIGRWTADMFLMNSLHRLDILAVDDLGLRKGAQLAFGLAAMPTRTELAAMGERWRPYRSLAAIYLWRSLDDRPPRPPEKQAVVTPARRNATARAKASVGTGEKKAGQTRAPARRATTPKRAATVKSVARRATTTAKRSRAT